MLSLGLCGVVRVKPLTELAILLALSPWRTGLKENGMTNARTSAREDASGRLRPSTCYARPARPTYPALFSKKKPCPACNSALARPRMQLLRTVPLHAF